jgi:hypothetical protein
MNLLLLALFLLVTPQAVWALRVADQPQPHRHFVTNYPEKIVNLDEPPEERWRNVTDYYLSIMQPALLPWMNTYQDPPNKDAWLAAIKSQMPLEYLREFNGYAAQIGHNLTTDRLLLNAVGYEQSRWGGCTAVLAAMPNGTVVHGRNMDISGGIVVNGLQYDYSDFTVNAIFMRNGKRLFQAVQWPGMIGVTTGLRFRDEAPNSGWTFEQNTRFTNNDPEENLKALSQGCQAFTLVSRQAMEYAADFDTARKIFRETPFAAPQYFILAGSEPYAGSIITVDRYGKLEQGTPPEMRLRAPEADSMGTHTWHLVQPNDDSNKVPIDGRRSMEEFKLTSARQADVSPKWMFQQMKADALRPIWDNTVFTEIMVPATGYNKLVLRDGDVPEDAPDVPHTF